jgi:ABC-2 type transport system permease protein
MRNPLRTLGFYGSLYKDFVAQYWKTLMASKVDFFFGLAAFLATQAGGILLLVFVFQAIPDLNGWSLHQVLFIYGFANLPRGIDHLLTDYLWLFAEHSVVEGEYDRYLLRPVSPLFQVLAERFQGDALGEILVGVIMIAIALPGLSLPITALSVFLFFILVAAGAVIYSSIKLFFASLAFWIKDSFPLLQIAYNFADFAKYPDSIFVRPISFFLSFVSAGVLHGLHPGIVVPRTGRLAVDGGRDIGGCRHHGQPGGYDLEGWPKALRQRGKLTKRLRRLVLQFRASRKTAGITGRPIGQGCI